MNDKSLGNYQWSSWSRLDDEAAKENAPGKTWLGTQ